MLISSIIATIILIVIILPIIFKNDENDIISGDKIVFNFSKPLKKIIFASMIISIIILIVFLIVTILSDNKAIIVASIFFSLLALLNLFLYLLIRNKKIIYENNILYVYNFICKKRIFSIQNLQNAIEIPSSGMKLIFDNNETIKIDSLMTNYSKIKDILENNGIIYKDKNEYNAPKGW